jgi:hypothetical protein
VTAEREAYNLTLRTLESVQDAASPQEVAPLKVLLLGVPVASPEKRSRDMMQSAAAMRLMLVIMVAMASTHGLAN